ncbi:cysteine protease ATG4B isoform X6 [Calonectris borealis]|uniref:cysteine protease ATG4B isoform X6 n=1 Tax=Calonectris borealis TaxID=1323832 RepID=UPI003F4BAE7E
MWPDDLCSGLGLPAFGKRTCSRCLSMRNCNPVSHLWDRDWRWIKGKRQMDNYFNVLNAFIDKKDSYYSIHQIAQMGVGEGKSIGQWYGPNTVAQVLKKLATFDTWSSLAVHIAMDNTVVMEEIRRLCQSNFPCAGAAACPAVESDVLYNGYPEEAGVRDRLSLWKPLVLLIPLRLGLTEINEAYIETLKHCFMMPQSLGVIGGKPNSAHYFIGYVGEELIYLDPHTTQPAVEPNDSGCLPDESFHCQHPPCRMSIAELDPSIAVGFFCNTEEDFNDWCQQIKKLSLVRGALPMFELVERQPSHFSNPDVLNLTPGVCSLLTMELEGWTGGIKYITLPHKMDCTNCFWESACCVTTFPSRNQRQL